MFNQSKSLRVIAQVTLTALLLAGPVCGQEEQDATNSLEERFRNSQPPFLVRAEVNHVSRDYREGDALSVKVASEVDAYLYVFYQQADGKKYQIFPNRLQPNNRAKARQAVRIPATDDLFRWKIGPPYGKEVIKVVASKEPIQGLADPALRQQTFNPLSGELLKGIELELGEAKPTEWADVDIAIHTYAQDDAIAPPGSKRYALFVGVSEYQFTSEYESIVGRPFNLGSAHHDARELAKTLREVGKFNEIRLLLNSEATRKKIEKAIFRWLPSVSRPGDTVLIYYAGHGSQIADIPGPDGKLDEKDRKDEILCPYDFITYEMRKKVIEKLKRKQPVDVTTDQYKHWQAVIDRARRQRKQVGLAMAHATGISDDVFAHWLQRLDGRKVIVIMDSCHSGGFATQEKGFEPSTRDISFDFLGQEFVRLRDLGQKETALMTACRKDESSIEIGKFEHGLMTYTLLDTLHKQPGRLTIQQSFDICQIKIRDYFKKTSKKSKRRPPTPVLYKNPQTRFFLKP